MRHVLIALAMYSLPAWAQDDLGGKVEPIASRGTSAAAGLGPLMNVLLALGIVYALLRFGLPKVMTRLNKRLVADVAGGIRITESATFAGGSLYLVDVRDRTLLISVGAQGVQMLADVTIAPAQPPTPTFGDLIEDELKRSANRSAESDEDRFPHESRSRRQIEQRESLEPSSGISEALRRLERLAG